MIGRILSGRYRIEAAIGEGGMSRVWRAHDMNTGKAVAVKVLKEEFKDDAVFVSRFEREAQAASRMSHPNITDLLDVGIDEDGVNYLVIEYIQGKTLKQYIKENGALRPEMAAQIIIRVLSAVAHAHQNGVIHRDIKPQNILIDKDGAVKVSDFGIARVVNAQTVRQDDEMIMGSVYYFSPEQAKGADVDEKSDLYSVGVMFYEMLTGHVPFTGETPVAIAIKHLREPPKPPSEVNSAVPPAMDVVVLRAMAKRPRSRYDSAAEMLRDVRLAIEHPDTILAARADMMRREREARLQEKRSLREHKRVSWQRALLMTAFSVVLLSGLVLAGSAIIGGLLRARQEKIEMPNVIGLKKEAGITLLTELNLRPTLTYGQYPLVMENIIADQSVAPGVLVSKGEIVTITISESEFDLRLSSYVGMSVDKAHASLSETGLVGENNYVMSEATPDTVVGQYPKSGSLMKKGETVTLSVSSGSVSMPILKDMTQFEAQQAVTAYGLVLGDTIWKNVDDPLKIGRVIEQMPEAFEKVKLKTTVTITVGVPASTLYNTQIVLDLLKLKPGGTVRITLEDGMGGEEAQYSETFEEPSATWPVTLYSRTARQTIYHIYFDDVLQDSKTVVFRP